MQPLGIIVNNDASKLCLILYLYICKMGMIIIEPHTVLAESPILKVL